MVVLKRFVLSSAACVGISALAFAQNGTSGKLPPKSSSRVSLPFSSLEKRNAKGFSIWLNLPRVRIGAPAATALLDKPNLRRVFIPMLSDGETPFIPETAPFRQMTLYKNNETDVSFFIEEAHAKKVAVYGTMNLLRWISPSRAMSGGSILDTRPDMMELVLGGTPGLPVFGWYASLFHADTRAALLALVQEITRRYPSLDGLVLQLQLPTQNLYGFSTAARQDCIRFRNIDPIDMELAPTGEAKDMLVSVAEQRLSVASSFMQTLCAAVRQKEKAGGKPLHIAIVGDASIYRYPLRIRSRSLNDWLSWLSIPGVDEVILLNQDNSAVTQNTQTETAPSTEESPLAYALSLVQQDKQLLERHPTFTTRIPLRMERRRTNLQTELRKVPLSTPQTSVGVLLEITDSVDLTDISWLDSLRSTQPL